MNDGEADKTVEVEVKLDIVEDIEVGGTKKKRKRRKGYRNKNGHRQDLSVLKINKISA